MEYQNEIICIYFISYNVGVWVGFLQLYQTDLNQQKSESGFVCVTVFGGKKIVPSFFFV